MTAAALRVLTVEDNPIVRADLRLILEDAGYDVCEEARDGVEAVDLAREHRPDLVLVDLKLPRLDGVEALRRIRADAEVPIVALTGHANRERLDDALAAGADRCVLKPFAEDELLGAVAGAIAERGRSAEREATDEHLRCLIDWMVRDGHTEGEIERAVRQAGGLPAERPPSLLERLRALFR
jgi:CheY-like chemotaxis protein